MFRHNKCGGFVFPVQKVVIRCGLSLTYDGIRIAGIGKISKIAPTKQGKITLTCDTCENEVNPSDIISRCMQCGNEFPLSSLFVLRVEGGVYCAECCDSFFENREKISAVEAINHSIG